MELRLSQNIETPTLHRVTLSYPITIKPEGEFQLPDCDYEMLVQEGVADQIRRRDLHFWFVYRVHYDDVFRQAHKS